MKFDRQVTKIVGPDFRAEAFVVPWDSEIFGFAVGQIDRIEVDGRPRIAGPADALREWLDAEEIRLASCRLESMSLKESMFLEANGFRFIEMVYSPALRPLSHIEVPGPKLEIEQATLNDLPAIESIAGSAFVTGRFLIDWRLEAEASHCRYRRWVTNSFEDSQQIVLKATLEGVIVGFFIIEERADGSVYWHLTAIDPGWQGKGIGKRLWSLMVCRHYASGVKGIETTVSAHNVSVMNIYAALGFKFGLPRMTLHWVRE